jgi:hypothetical protein
MWPVKFCCCGPEPKTKRAELLVVDAGNTESASGIHVEQQGEILTNSRETFAVGMMLNANDSGRGLNLNRSAGTAGRKEEDLEIERGANGRAGPGKDKSTGHANVAGDSLAEQAVTLRTLPSEDSIGSEPIADSISEFH